MQFTRTTKQSAPLLVFSVLACCLCINAAVAIWALITRPELNSDFHGPWSFARFSVYQAARIYDAAPLQAFQQRIYPGFHSFFPFQYPPSFLGPIEWLNDFSYTVAQVIWTATGLGALFAASWLFFAPSLRVFAFLALLAAPASLLNFVGGETGYFTAAFLLAGFALLPSRPGLAGLAFGMLTLKPQLGLLIPLALLARKDYRAMGTASLTALVLIGWSWAKFPVDLWAAWLRQMPVYQAQYMTAHGSGMSADITIAASLIRLGAPPDFGWWMQAVVSLATAAAVFVVFQRAPYHLAVAALLTGSLLCTPHGYAYDTTQLTAAMLLTYRSPAIGLCVLTYLAPYLLLTGARSWFFYAIPETLLFFHIVYLALDPAAHSHIADEPIYAKQAIGQH